MSELPKDIKDIDVRIRKIRAKKEAKAPKSQINIMLQNAFRFAAEFVSPVIIALALGYLADNFFDTKPVIMLVMAAFGCAAGVLNTYKAMLEIDKDMK